MAETPTFTMRATPEQQPILREVCRFVRSRPDGMELLRRFLDEEGRRTPEASAAPSPDRMDALQATLVQVSDEVVSVSRRITDTVAQAETAREALRQEFTATTAQLAERITELTNRVTDLEKERVAYRDTVKRNSDTLPRAAEDGQDDTGQRMEAVKARIDAMRAEGLSQRAIAERLNAEGVTTPARRGKWVQSAVSDFIKAHGLQ